MNQQMMIVLVHGAGTGPWIWRRLQDSLPLPSVAVAVPSRRKDATPASCADQIVQDIDKAGAERVVLVLHSLAGVLASELAARLGDRIASTVFLAAVVPAPGKRFVDAMGFPNSLVLRVLFKLNPQGLKPSESMLRAELGSDLSEADAAALVDRYEAEWPGLYLGRVGDARSVPRPAYIRLTSDRSVPPKLQDRMIANLQNPQVLDLDAGHMAMLSKPDELGRLIMQAIASA
jgi:pimeloyl-ACP methyl ester carboxylesterase